MKGGVGSDLSDASGVMLFQKRGFVSRRLYTFCLPTLLIRSNVCLNRGNLSIIRAKRKVKEVLEY